MASIHKRSKSPYWWGKFTGPDGRAVFRSTKRLKANDAREVVGAWEKASKLARNRELTQAASIQILDSLMRQTVGEALETVSISAHLREYVTSRETMGRAEATSKRYKGIVENFLTFLGGERGAGGISSLTASEIEKWRNVELTDGKGGTTADFGVNVLRGALEAARRKGLALSNPADKVERVGSVAEEREPFTDSEIGCLLKKADADWQGMILLAAHHGLRIADVANLTWGQIDFNEATMTLVPAKTKRTAPKPKIEALHDDVMDHIRQLPRGIGAAPLFPSLYGRKPGSHAGLSNEFSRLMNRAGIVVTLGTEKKGKGRQTRSKGFHSLRHTMITAMAVTDGVPEAVRKAISGHSTDSAHKKYIHLTLNTKREAVSRVRSLTKAKTKKVRAKARA